MKSPCSYDESSRALRSGLLPLAAVIGTAALTLLVTKREMLPFAASLSGLILLPAALTAAVAVYAAWRLRPSVQRSWLTAALTILALQALAISVVQLSTTGHARGQQTWSRLSDLLVMIVIAGYCTAGLKGQPRRDPLSIGFLAGTALAVVRVVTVTQLPGGRLDTSALVGLEACFLALMAVAVLCVSRHHGLRRGSRVQLLIAGAMVGAGQYVAAYLPAGEAAAFAVLLLDSVGAVVAAHAALGMLRRTLIQDRDRVAQLEERFWMAEEGVRSSRARLHEVNATLAGISSASRMLRGGLTSVERRQRLQEMMDEELARLTRLLAGKEHLIRPVPVDDLVSTLAVAHEARGHAVRWEQSGAVMLGRRDDVHEVLNILLDNAAKHGSGAATVTVTEVVDGVEIEVRDEGPGVAPDVDVFVWGHRGPRSHGQGIGLCIARELMEAQGGYLRLRPSTGTGTGATFVLGLPTAKEWARDAVACA